MDEINAARATAGDGTLNDESEVPKASGVSFLE